MRAGGVPLPLPGAIAMDQVWADARFPGEPAVGATVAPHGPRTAPSPAKEQGSASLVVAERVARARSGKAKEAHS